MSISELAEGMGECVTQGTWKGVFGKVPVPSTKSNYIWGSQAGCFTDGTWLPWDCPGVGSLTLICLLLKLLLLPLSPFHHQTLLSQQGVFWCFALSSRCKTGMDWATVTGTVTARCARTRMCVYMSVCMCVFNAGLYKTIKSSLKCHKI